MIWVVCCVSLLTRWFGETCWLDFFIAIGALCVECLGLLAGMCYIECSYQNKDTRDGRSKSTAVV